MEHGMITTGFFGSMQAKPLPKVANYLNSEQPCFSIYLS